MHRLHSVLLVCLLVVSPPEASTRIISNSGGVQKLLLTSNGLTTPELQAEFTRLLHANNARDPRVLYVPDAAIGEGGKEPELCARRSRELKSLGARTVDCVTLKRGPPDLADKLGACDAVYVDYGNTYYLMYYMQTSGFAKLIKTAVEGGTLYIGASASSITAGKTISIAFWKGWDDPGYGTEWDLKRTKSQYDGLGLVPNLSFFPHYAPRWKSLIEQKKRTIDHQVIPLDDSQGFLVEGAQWRLIGGTHSDRGVLHLEM